MLEDSSYGSFSLNRGRRQQRQRRDGSLSVSDVSAVSVIFDTFSTFESSTIASVQEQVQESGLIIAKQASLPHMPVGRRSNDLSDLTINKLNFKAIQLYGREEQLVVLQESWEQLKRSCSATASSSSSSIPPSRVGAGYFRKLVTIAGPSGTGKSRLAHVLSEWSKAEQVGLVVRGKFDCKQRQKYSTTITNEDGTTSTIAMTTSISPSTGSCVEPFSGIARACGDILGSIMAMKNSASSTVASQEWTDAVCHTISTELGPELSLLEQFIPAMSEVFVEVVPEGKRASTSTADTDQETRAATTAIEGISSDSRKKNNSVSAATTTSVYSAEETSNQIIFAFQRFIRAIAQNFQPLVMVIDDLQWADDASLDLLEALLVDGKNSIPNILLLGLYRSDEVDKTHFLYRRLTAIQDKARAATYHYQSITVDNLTVHHVECMIKDLLSFDSCYSDDQNGNDYERLIASLAQLCMDKTLGNAFFLLQFLSSLYQKRLLIFNFGTMKWNWDEKTIKLQTNASANVKELLQAKMQDLDKRCVEILKLAAFLGSMINRDCLKILWRKFFQPADEGIRTGDQSFVAMVEILEQIGFLISVTEMSVRSYTWAHDKVHEAAMSLIPEEQRPSFCRGAGEALLSELGEDEREACLFTIVNLLNAGIDYNDGSSLTPIDIATLNRAATQKAVAISAFESAAEYARIGIRSLPKTKWKTAYQVAMDLYSLGAKAEGYLGRVEIMDRYCRAVLGQKVGKEEDKLRVYNVMIDSMVFRGQVDDAVAIMINVLQRAKCNFPTNLFLIYVQIIRGLIRTRTVMKHIAPSKLKVMNDPSREELVELMKRLNVCFYISGDRRYPLTGFRCVSWATKFGVCGASSGKCPQTMTSASFPFVYVNS
jgi:predicted ATPase